VSLTWLFIYIVDVYEQLPVDLNFKPIDSKSTTAAIFLLEVEADELWNFVGNKDNKQWIWIVLDVHTRQVIAFHVGRCDRDAARELWQKIPESYKQHADFYTDLYEVYMGVIPDKQHHRVIKQVVGETY